MERRRATNWIRRAGLEYAGPHDDSEHDLRYLRDASLQYMGTERMRERLARVLLREEDGTLFMTPPTVDFLSHDLRENPQGVVANALQERFRREMSEGSFFRSFLSLSLATILYSRQPLPGDIDGMVADFLRKNPSALGGVMVRPDYLYEEFLKKVATSGLNRGGPTDRVLVDHIVKSIRWSGREPWWASDRALKDRFDLRRDDSPIPKPLADAVYGRLLESGSIMGNVHDIARNLITRKKPTGGLEYDIPDVVIRAADKWMSRGMETMNGNGFSFLCDVAEELLATGQAPKRWAEMIVAAEDKNHWRTKRWLPMARKELGLA